MDNTDSVNKAAGAPSGLNVGLGFFNGEKSVKFLEIKTERGFVRFALDSVMTYGMVLIEKKGRKKEHCLVSVKLKPVKGLDGEAYGVVVERCETTDLEFADFEAAQKAMSIIEA